MPLNPSGASEPLLSCPPSPDEPLCALAHSPALLSSSSPPPSSSPLLSRALACLGAKRAGTSHFLVQTRQSTPRNQTQEPAISVQIVLGRRFLILDFALYMRVATPGVSEARAGELAGAFSLRQHQLVVCLLPPACALARSLPTLRSLQIKRIPSTPCPSPARSRI